jgi:hypothetical protein
LTKKRIELDASNPEAIEALNRDAAEYNAALHKSQAAPAK